MAKVPQDFARALKAAGLTAFFLNYPPSHQREHLKWIAEAKLQDARKKRIAKTIGMLNEKASRRAR